MIAFEKTIELEGMIIAFRLLENNYSASSYWTNLLSELIISSSDDKVFLKKKITIIFFDNKVALGFRMLVNGWEMREVKDKDTTWKLIMRNVSNSVAFYYELKNRKG